MSEKAGYHVRKVAASSPLSVRALIWSKRCAPVVLQVLTPEHRGQVPPRLRVVALDEAEALGRPVRRDSLADNDHEVGLLALPVAQVAAIDADRDRLRGCRQAGTLTRTAGEREARLGAELGLQTAGHL